MTKQMKRFNLSNLARRAKSLK